MRNLRIIMYQQTRTCQLLGTTWEYTQSIYDDYDYTTVHPEGLRITGP